MMATVLILELDAVRGVVGIGDFTVYVSDGDGCQGTTYLNDVDIARKEELGEVLGFLEGKHRGLHVILVGQASDTILCQRNQQYRSSGKTKGRRF